MAHSCTHGAVPCRSKGVSYVKRRGQQWAMHRKVRSPLTSSKAMGSGFGEELVASPFALMDRQMQLMNEQMRAMDREFMEMDRMMKQDVEKMLQESRELTEKANREVQDELQKAQQTGEVMRISRPNVTIERSEQREPGSYRYYESIQIRPGYAASYQTVAAQQTLASGPSAAVLAAVFILAGAYAAVTTAFAKAYDATIFKEEAKWKLLLLWPFLLVLSKKFRQQFTAVFTGRPVTVEEDGNKGS